jgi:hypothetical protein
VCVCTVLLGLLAAGCTADEGTTSADCAVAIRHDGTVYVEAGFTKHPAVASGQAERSECHDVGPDAAGTVFPEEPRLVHVVAFEGHDARQVLGVRDGKQARVFVADGVDAERVMSALDDE